MDTEEDFLHFLESVRDCELSNKLTLQELTWVFEAYNDEYELPRFVGVLEVCELGFRPI